MRHFIVAGNHPNLSFAETGALFPEATPTLIGPVAFFETPTWNEASVMTQLAGAIKIGDEAFSVSLETPLDEAIADWIETHPREKRILFGLTVFNDSNKRFAKLPLQLKRALQAKNYSVRWVTGDHGELSPAAISKLDLTRSGYDFVVAIKDSRVFVGVTTQVQNADVWSHLDFNRPRRDAKNGMLPPKLAQLMVNLAEHHEGTLLDPFCGGGTILGQAAFLGYTSLIGSDISAKQVDDAKQNLAWMEEDHLIEPGLDLSWYTSDATTLDRVIPPQSIHSIVTEGFLGAPLTGYETYTQLQQNAQEVTRLWKDSLRAFAKLQPTGGRIVGIWPTLSGPDGQAIVELNAAQLTELGYQRILPRWNHDMSLVYARPDQFVKRNIVILERI